VYTTPTAGLPWIEVSLPRIVPDLGTFPLRRLLSSTTHVPSASRTQTEVGWTRMRSCPLALRCLRNELLELRVGGELHERRHQVLSRLVHAERSLRFKRHPALPAELRVRCVLGLAPRTLFRASGLILISLFELDPVR